MPQSPSGPSEEAGPRAQPGPGQAPAPDRSNPWKTTSSRAVYDNPWIHVREDQVVRPDGLPGIYGVVHFKNNAVGVLPVDDQGRVWLVGQHRYPLNAYSWEIPEGGGPDHEPPKETALRELREETGLIAGQIELVAVSHLSNSVSDEIGYVFRATDLAEGPARPEGCERLEVRRFEWCEAWAMLERGEITDSLSVIALLREALRRAGPSFPHALGEPRQTSSRDEQEVIGGDGRD